MAYHIEIWDTANTTRLGSLAKVSNAKVAFQVSGEHSLSFDVSKVDAAYIQVTGERYARIVDNNDSTIYRSFIIRQVEKDFDAGIASVTCEGLKNALMNNILEEKTYALIDLSTALDLALAGSGFTAGTINAGTTELRNIDFTGCKNSLQALELIIQTYYDTATGPIYYKVNENKTVSIYNEANLGTQYEFYVSPGKNIKGLKLNRNFKNMANRIYGRGQGGFTFRRYSVDDDGNQQLYAYQLRAGEYGCGAGSGKDYIQDQLGSESGLHIYAEDLFNGFNLWCTVGTGEKGHIADTIVAELDPGLDHVIVMDYSFVGGTPDDHDTYYPCYFADDDEITYDLGLAWKNVQPLAVGTQIKGNFYADPGSGATPARACYWAINITDEMDGIHKIKIKTEWTNLSPGVSFKATISLLDDSDATVSESIFEWTWATGSLSGWYWSQLRDMKYWCGYNLPYVENTTLQATWSGGQPVSDVYENANLEDTINLVKSPAMDGTYTDGVCENWTGQVGGAGTLTENTNPEFIRNGSRSMEMDAGAVSMPGGQGWTSAPITIKDNTPYSAYFLIYMTDVAGASMRCIVTDGTTENYYITSGIGWLEIVIENFSYGTDPNIDREITMKVIVEAGAPRVYWDSAMIHEGPTVKNFVVGDSAAILYAETYAELVKRWAPEDTYDLDFIDLIEIDPAKYAGHAFIEGDRIRLVYPDESIDTHFLVASREFDPLDPVNPKIQLNKKIDPYRPILKTMQLIANSGRKA
jgi:phage minor structural protein